MASHSLSLGKNQRLKFTPSKGCLTILPIKPGETGLRHGLPRGWNAKFEAGMRYSPLLRNVHRSSFINLCSAQFSRGSLPKMGVYNYLETLLWEPTKLSTQNHSLSDWVGPQVYSVSLTAKNKHSLATKTDEATHELLAFRQKCAEHSWEGARIQARAGFVLPEFAAGLASLWEFKGPCASNSVPFQPLPRSCRIVKWGTNWNPGVF